MNREDIELINEDALFFDNPSYDDAIIGQTTDGRIVYDYNLIINSLLEQGICEDYLEAIDYISYDIERALGYWGNVGKLAPIIVEMF